MSESVSESVSEFIECRAATSQLKIEDIEEYDQDEWKKILKNYGQLEASVKDENDGLDSGVKG